MREMCTNEPAMKIARRELVQKEKNPTGIRKREALRSEEIVFPLMEERNSVSIVWMNPTIREKGRLQIIRDQEVFN